MAGFQYNPAQVAAALRMSGANNPALLEQLQQQQQTPPMDAQPVPPEVDRALETLGSSYRVPREQPAPPPETTRERDAAIPSNPYPEAPSERHYDPRASTKQLTSNRTDLMNEQVDLAGRKGEIASEGYQQQAAAAGELEQRNRQGFEATQGRVEQNRTDRAALEAQAADRLARITQLVDQGPPKPSVMSKVMGIIGTVLSVAGGNERAQAMGRGVSMLGQSMQGDSSEWKQQIAGNQAVHSQLLAAAQNEGDDSESGVTVEKGLQDLGAGVYNSALERIKAESQSEEVKRAASELQNGLLMKFTTDDLAHRAKAQRQRADDMLYNMGDDQLAAEIAAGHGGKRARDIYANIAKQSQDVREGEAKISLTQAQADKARRESEGGPKLTDAQEKRDVLVQGAKNAYDRLLPTEGRLNRGATNEQWVPDIATSTDSLQQRADIKALFAANLRAASGASISEGDVQSAWEANPVNSGDPQVRQQAVRDVIKAFESLDVRGRLPKVDEQARGRADQVVKPVGGPGGGGAPAQSREPLARNTRGPGGGM
jgi:hypothetical protein